MASLSIVTPWHNCPELIKPYRINKAGAEVIIVDNGSTPENAAALAHMVAFLRGVLIRNEVNRLFAPANNQGLKMATGDVVLFLNNDTLCRSPSFVRQVCEDVQDGALYGPARLERPIAGRLVPYIEGWCIAATRTTWDALGGWPEYEGLYWEDNQLCFTALEMGMTLIETTWDVFHEGNHTSRRTPGAYDTSRSNYDAFIERVQKAQPGRG